MQILSEKIAWRRLYNRIQYSAICVARIVKLFLRFFPKYNSNNIVYGNSMQKKTFLDVDCHKIVTKTCNPIIVYFSDHSYTINIYVSLLITIDVRQLLSFTCKAQKILLLFQTLLFDLFFLFVFIIIHVY